MQHELGHLIDRRANTVKHKGTRISDDAKYISALKADVKAAEKSMKEELQKQTGGKVRIGFVRVRVATEIMKSGAGITAGLQDIFGGVIKAPYPGARFRHSAAYWNMSNSWFLATSDEKDQRLAKEAFANMYEACSCKEAAAAMEKWLPNSFKRFKELLADIASD